MRVGVVGAGFAGLSAASRLRETGHEVEVFEARHRVGGRVWSQELIPGDPRTIIERGAEFVLDGYERMHAIAGELGLSFADMSMSYYVREPRNGSATTLEAISACAERVAKAAAMAPWGTSLADVVADLEAELDSAALTAYVSRLVVTNGCPEDRLAATNAADMTVGFTTKPSLRVIGGNQAVAIGMAERLGDAVRLNTVVSAIEWDSDEVRLRTVHDETPFDFVVLAVPLAVARELHFDPMLPEWKLQAWERSGLGQAAKLHIPIRGDAGYGAVQDVSERFWTWTATDGTGLVQPVLHCFAGSAPALSQLQVDSGPQTWANRVAQIRPELDLDLENAIVTTWSDDRYAREAYSAVTVDVAEDDDNLMSAPVGALHFAGEHTAGAWAGLMEGAIRSGERAADELLP